MSWIVSYAFPFIDNLCINFSPAPFSRLIHFVSIDIWELDIFINIVTIWTKAHKRYFFLKDCHSYRCFTHPHMLTSLVERLVSVHLWHIHTMNENICHHHHHLLHFCGCTPHAHGVKATMLTESLCVWWYWELPGLLSLVVELWAWIQFCEQRSHLNHLSLIPALNYSFICL